MDVNFSELFVPPNNYNPPAEVLLGNSQFPNLNSIEFRNKKHNENAAKSPFYEMLTANLDQSTFLLVSNSYTGRLWNSSIFGYANIDDIDKLGKETLKISTDSHVTGIKFFKNQMILLTTSCGSIQLWSTQSQIRQNNETCYLVSKIGEHIGGIRAMDLLGKNKAITASTDAFIKIWDIESCDLISKKTYSNAHGNIIKGLCSKPDSDRMFASCSDDRKLVIWDIRSSEAISAMWKNPRVENTTCSWQKINDKELLFLGDIAGDVHVFDPRNLKDALDKHHLFDWPIFKFKKSQNAKLLCVLAQCSTIKVVSNSADMGLIYENSTAEDYVRDVCWLKNNGTNKQILYSVGWNKSVHKHTF